MATNGRIKRDSLWLVPPKDSQLYKTLSALINQDLPPLFPEALPPNFTPHITLTADTVPNDLANPQEWLDQIPLRNCDGLKVTIGNLEIGNIFFQKVIQLCDKTGPMSELAATCRRVGTGESEEETKEWVERNWKPHCSLVYSNLPREDVLGRLESITSAIHETKEASAPHCLTARGASIWLVPTSKDVGEWSPVATRELDANVEWYWNT